MPNVQYIITLYIPGDWPTSVTWQQLEDEVIDPVIEKFPGTVATEGYAMEGFADDPKWNTYKGKQA